MWHSSVSITRKKQATRTRDKFTSGYIPHPTPLYTHTKHTHWCWWCEEANQLGAQRNLRFIYRTRYFLAPFAFISDSSSCSPAAAAATVVLLLLLLLLLRHHFHLRAVRLNVVIGHPMRYRSGS